MEGLDDFQQMVVDVFVCDANLPAHAKLVQQFLTQSAVCGISLNAQKFVFAWPIINVIGFLVILGHLQHRHRTDLDNGRVFAFVCLVKALLISRFGQSIISIDIAAVWTG